MAVIPSVTVENVSGIKGLSDCFVHVTSNNTTYYIDDKGRMMITWAGPIEAPGYDYEANPLKLRSQSVYDFANDRVIYYNGTGDYRVVNQSAILYDTTGDNTDGAMTQKATTEFLGSLIINGGTDAPTTDTVGAIGTLYTCVDSGTGHLYICTDDTGGSYTWNEITNPLP